ncbi:MAG TPA: hypothetical protein VGP19_03465 [Candidatus Acidoferrales bacterium]|jgi:hypothetical protein|nr:hypothetical protein [Candidatus Acidoferrales bacterium]
MGVINPMLQPNENEWSADRPESYEYHARRKSFALWIIVAIFAVALGALVYFGYRTVKTQDTRITEVFGKQGTLNTLGQRTDAAESKLHSLTGDWEGIGRRIAKLEGNVAADIRTTRKYAETLTQQVHQQMTAEMETRTSALDARLSKVESEEAAERTQVAQLEANLKQEIAAAREETGRDLSGVRELQAGNARDVGALSHRLDRQRIDFELAKGQTKELTPGISLRIGGVNASHERYHGALSLLQDHRTLWLRDQSAHESVRFFPVGAGEPYDLVVTDVTKTAVSGYLLAPVRPTTSAGALLVGQQTGVDDSAHE